MVFKLKFRPRILGLFVMQNTEEPCSCKRQMICWEFRVAKCVLALIYWSLNLPQLTIRQWLNSDLLCEQLMFVCFDLIRKIQTLPISDNANTGT